VLNVTPGNVETTPRSEVMSVGAAHGIANLKGKSVAERAQAPIGIAHPDRREHPESRPTSTV
jgi:acyl-CoA hydrolase